MPILGQDKKVKEHNVKHQVGCKNQIDLDTLINKSYDKFLHGKLIDSNLISPRENFQMYDKEKNKSALQIPGS